MVEYVDETETEVIDHLFADKEFSDQVMAAVDAKRRQKAAAAVKAVNDNFKRRARRRYVLLAVITWLMMAVGNIPGAIVVLLGGIAACKHKEKADAIEAEKQMRAIEGKERERLRKEAVR